MRAITRPPSSPVQAPQSVGRLRARGALRAATQRWRRWPATQVMSAEMTIPAATHRAKQTLNEPSSITGGSVAQFEEG